MTTAQKKGITRISAYTGAIMGVVSVVGVCYGWHGWHGQKLRDYITARVEYMLEPVNVKLDVMMTKEQRLEAANILEMNRKEKE